MILQHNTCTGGTGFYAEKLDKVETVLWDSNSKLKEEKNEKKNNSLYNCDGIVFNCQSYLGGSRRKQSTTIMVTFWINIKTLLLQRVGDFGRELGVLNGWHKGLLQV